MLQSHKEKFRSFFHLYFIFWFLFHATCMIAGMIVILPYMFKMTLWPQNATNFLLVAGTLSSPVMMVLMTTNPQFKNVIKEEVFIDPKYPKWIAWVAKKMNMIADTSYRFKSSVLVLYTKKYTVFFRGVSFLASSLWWSTLVLVSKKVFDMEAKELLHSLAFYCLYVTVLLAVIYFFTTNSPSTNTLKE